MPIKIPMNSGWVFIMYSSSAKLDKKQIYQHSIVRENGEQCKYQDRARRAVFNKRSCKFMTLTKVLHQKNSISKLTRAIITTPLLRGRIILLFW